MCVDRGELREGPGEATDRRGQVIPLGLGEAMRREMMNALCGHYPAPAQGFFALGAPRYGAR